MQKNLKDILLEGKIHFYRPNQNQQHNEITADLEETPHEAMPEHVKKELDYLKDMKNWAKAIEDGKVEKLKPKDGKDIHNFTSEPNSYKDLPKKKREHVEKEYKEKLVEMPIILRHKKDGYMWLLAGNTRTTYAFEKLGKKVKALIIDY